MIPLTQLLVVARSGNLPPCHRQCCSTGGPKGAAMSTIVRERPLAYPMPWEGRRASSAPAVREPRASDWRYRASSLTSAEASARAGRPSGAPESPAPRVRLHLQPGHRGTKQLLAEYGASSSAAAIATMPGGGSGSTPWRSSSPNTTGAASVPPRPRPPRSVAHPLCRRDRPRPGEAGRRDVESKASGLAAAPRSRGRPRPDQSHRRRRGTQYWMPGAERRASTCRCPGGIQVEYACMYR